MTIVNQPQAEDSKINISETKHVIILISIITFASIIGSLYTSTFEDISEQFFNPKFNINLWLIHGVKSFIAAALTPLFLRAIMSDLLEPTRIMNYFFIFGFCLTSSLYADSIIKNPILKDQLNQNSITEKVLINHSLLVKDNIEDSAYSPKEALAKFGIIPKEYTNSIYNKNHFEIDIKDILENSNVHTRIIDNEIYIISK